MVSLTRKHLPSVLPRVVFLDWIFFFHHPASHSLIRNRQQMKQNSTGAAPISIHSHQGTGSKRIGSDSSRWLPPRFRSHARVDRIRSSRNEMPLIVSCHFWDGGRQAMAEHKWNPILSHHPLMFSKLCHPIFEFFTFEFSQIGAEREWELRRVVERADVS